VQKGQTYHEAVVVAAQGNLGTAALSNGVDDHKAQAIA
jgi:hypothetical protein